MKKKDKAEEPLKSGFSTTTTNWSIVQPTQPWSAQCPHCNPKCAHGYPVTTPTYWYTPPNYYHWYQPYKVTNGASGGVTYTYGNISNAL